MIKILLIGLTFYILYCLLLAHAFAQSGIDNFWANHPIHIKNYSSYPTGISPDQIKQIYHLPSSGGRGTIAIIGAFDAPEIESDLVVFSKQFNLSTCTSSNGCFEKHKMSSSLGADSGWEVELALDTEWAHVIAPMAKILLVEASSARGADLLKAVDYARARPDVVAISMSWGGGEFIGETKLDNHFNSKSGVSFFEIF